MERIKNHTLDVSLEEVAKKSQTSTSHERQHYSNTTQEPEHFHVSDIDNVLGYTIVPPKNLSDGETHP